MKNPIQVCIGTLDLASFHCPGIVKEKDKYALVCVPSVQSFGSNKPWLLKLLNLNICTYNSYRIKTCFRFKFVYG